MPAGHRRAILDCPFHNGYHAGVARPREFDPDQVLEQAMLVFWQRGYEATSIRHLVAATRIGRASLYATFGGKHRVFVRALKLYQQRVLRGFVDTLDADRSGRRAIRRVLRQAARMHATQKRGCLILNSAVELGPYDREVVSCVESCFTELEAAFARAVRRAQAAGELPRRRKPSHAARFLVSAVQGLGVVARTAPGRRALHDIAAMTEAALS
jgi:TetR/AcrR family transcriptional repressor of nem operon